MAVSGVMVRLPAMISLIRRVGRPMISASSVCDQPRASSSSLRNSPGGKISAAVFIQASLGRSVVIADGHDDNELAGFVLLQPQPQTPLVVESHGTLAVPIDRKSVVVGKSVAVREDLGGARIIKKQK